MAIEGPLRELGIHDVFQLLDLSRKTGVLKVTSDLRDDEGIVIFESGRVAHASIRSNPAGLEQLLEQSGRVTAADVAKARAALPPGDRRGVAEILVELGLLTQRELERQVRMQIESVIFDLMSWREGFFSFEERSAADIPHRAPIKVSTESLLMEGARRIDEWSRIADKIPSLAVIPSLAPVDDEREASQLDLLPHEWEVLTMIDGARDLRGIAASLGRPEFDIAKIAYGLVTTGVITVRAPERREPTVAPKPRTSRELQRARAALAEGSPQEALDLARSAVAVADTDIDARLVAARALMRLGQFEPAFDELRRAMQRDPLTAETYRLLGTCAVRLGDLEAARAHWQHFIGTAPADPEAPRVAASLDTLDRLLRLMEGDDA